MVTETLRKRSRWGLVALSAFGLALGILLADSIYQMRTGERIGARTGERSQTIIADTGNGNPYGECVNGVSDQVDNAYFNSCEPGCGANGQALNPDYLMCDDFEDGGWMATNADTDGGKANPANDGWGGTIFYTWPDPQGTDWARCGSEGVGGTDCAATTSTMSWSGGGTYPEASSGINAKHWFYPNEPVVEDVYMRWYMKQLPGFIMGHEKINNFANDQRSWIAGIAGKNFGSGCPAMDSYQDTGLLTQNQGNTLCLENNKWYYLEMRVKLNTVGQADGIYQFWFDDCGADGLGCTGPGTLRASYNNRVWRLNAADQIHYIWIENWGNQGSIGEEYYDQVIYSKSRVGPMVIQ